VILLTSIPVDLITAATEVDLPDMPFPT